MSINRRMDKEGVVHIYMEYYSAIKRNEIVQFADMDRPRDCHTE